MLDSLPVALTMLIALSVATERAVEIIKSLSPWLNTAHPDAKTEGWRRAALQVMAVISGIAIAAFTWPVIAEVLERPAGDIDPLTVGAVGLLASGGSGFWNTILTYVLKIKDLKAAEVKERAAQPAEATVIPHPKPGTLRS